MPPTPLWAETRLNVTLNQLENITQSAIKVFFSNNLPNGQFKGIKYWQAANAYTAIALHDLWSGTKRNEITVRNGLKAVREENENYINEFNDDSMWWAHALLAASRAYGFNDVLWLNQSNEIQHHVAKSVIPDGQVFVLGNDMGGGCLWTTKPDEQDVNSITTGLFAELSANLISFENISTLDTVKSKDKFQSLHRFIAKITRKLCDLCIQPSRTIEHSSNIVQPYEVYANKALYWIQHYRLNDQFIVLDTIKIRDQKMIDWEFTYLNGQAIGACIALIRLKQSKPNLDEIANIEIQNLFNLANDLSLAAMTKANWVEKDGTLTEYEAYGPKKHNALENNDAVGFKSVLIRNLAKLYDFLGPNHTMSNIIRGFINVQFNSLISKNTNGKDEYGPWWSGPMDTPTSHSQLAILDVMAAVHLVNKEHNNNSSAVETGNP